MNTKHCIPNLGHLLLSLLSMKGISIILVIRKVLLFLIIDANLPIDVVLRHIHVATLQVFIWLTRRSRPQAGGCRDDGSFLLGRDWFSLISSGPDFAIQGFGMCWR